MADTPHENKKEEGHKIEENEKEEKTKKENPTPKEEGGGNISDADSDEYEKDKKPNTKIKRWGKNCHKTKYNAEQEIQGVGTMKKPTTIP